MQRIWGNSSGCQTVNNQVSHNRRIRKISNRAGKGALKCIILLCLNGSFEASDLRDLNIVFACDIDSSCTRTKQGLDFTRTQGLIFGNRLDARTITTDSTSQFVCDRGGVTTAFTVGEYQCFLVSTDSEKIKIDHRFSSLLRGQIFSKMALKSLIVGARVLFSSAKIFNVLPCSAANVLRGSAIHDEKKGGQNGHRLRCTS